MSYIKLVNFEVKRVFKLFLALSAVVALLQIATAILSAVRFKKNARQPLQSETLSLEAYGDYNYAKYTIHNFINEGMFFFSIVLAIAMLIIYMFFIWYRDWFGKSSFIYRLLMLPTARSNVYFAKLTTILLFAFCLLSVQIVLIEIAQLIIKAIIPAQLLQVNVMAVTSLNILSILIPQSVSQFLLSYGLGMVLVAIIFTAILFERSFHLKGIFLAGFYSSLSLALLFAPLIMNEFINYFFYENELLLLVGFTALIVFAIAVYLANYLLNRKINV